jgi:guanidinoacetate N-methyltransferase
MLHFFIRRMRTSPTDTFGDIRDITTSSRKDIGFQEREAWRNSPAVFSSHELTIQGHPVMEDWEDEYMKLLASIATSNGGAILEVGYGMGISTRYIQEHIIKEHTIIEANQDVFEKLVTYANTSAHTIVPMLGFWEEVVTSLPNESFDGILFDTYPLTEEDIHVNHFSFFKEAYRLLKPGGILTYYSDEIIDFSLVHLELLQEAGFRDINKQLCSITPPPDCKYWKSATIVAPIVRK